MTQNKFKKSSDKNVFEQTWDFFASVKLAIIVLILIAATSIIGTLIPQNAADAFYLHKYGEFRFKLFTMLNIFDMYHAWWFLLLLFLLVINIIACSIDRLSKTWKIIFPKKVSFNTERFKKNKNQESFAIKNDMEKIAPQYKEFVSKRFKTIVEQKTENSIAIFGEKGRWTRFGVYIVHISILLLLVGALIGGLVGFKGHINLNEGESADSVVISEQKGEKKFGFTIKCNTFDVKFYDTGAPEEFKSNISIIENGKEILTEDIIVNDPLRYKSINFFQSSYGVSSADNLTLEIESKKSKMIYHQKLKIGDNFDLPEAGGNFELIRYLPQFDFKGHNLGQSFIGKIKKGDGKEIMVILPTRFPTFDKMRQGDFAFIAENFTKKYYTGLQVTYDPGVIFVYIGFVLMIAGCFVTFFMSHQSIMVEITKGKKSELFVLISGKANRNNQSMKIKIEKLAKQLMNAQLNK
jgi:cytochrome c biogenesis protein